jgi:mono/diheme cytochrome c family protein
MRLRPRHAAIAGSWLLVVAFPLVAAPQSARSGVYTAEQAVKGETIYYARCAECHGDDLAGVERAPALAGGSFVETWHGQPLRKLLEVIEKMPPDEPSAVTTAEAADVLAFLLSAAGLPSGSTALPSDRVRLGAIVFERVTP